MIKFKFVKIIKFSSVCPECSSSDYVEGVDVEYCDSCGYGVRYN